MELSALLGAIGSIASIEAEIRGIIGSCVERQAKDKLNQLCAASDFSRLPDEVADCMDKVEIYLGHRKSKIIGNQLFSGEEKKAFVSDFFASRIDLQPFQPQIEPIIMKYVDNLERLLQQQMSTGEKVIYTMQRRIDHGLKHITDAAACSNTLSAPQIQDVIEQVRAELPEDYIERKIIPHHIAVMSRIDRLLASEEPVLLKDAVLKHNRVLLLSDAGHGKSTELRYAACALSEASIAPYFYSLYYYCREPIQDILPACYSNIQSARMALIFDGFDEMLEPERAEFMRKLSSFLNAHPDTKVLISSRSNFCKAEVENQSQTFKGFYVCDLDDLTPSDIEAYVRKQGVDVNRFRSEALRVGIEDLLHNPFYLANLIQLYREKNQLPGKGAVMEQLVRRSFALDSEKFQADLEEHHRHLFAVLEKIAFAMQLMHKQDINDSSEYQELFAPEERSLAKHSGLFRKDGNHWKFLHSNFREYLAAKYLSGLPKEDIVRYLSDGYGIKNSFVNTLSYLISMDLEWDIRSWLLEFSPNVLVKFETGHLTDDTKANILKSQFVKFEAALLWISDSLFSVEQLASFGCCEDSLSFLLDRISHPVNHISQISAVHLLGYFPRLYGRKQAVTETLLACCANPSEKDNPLCARALHALSKQDLVTPEITALLVTKFQNCYVPEIRQEMYRLLLRSKQHNAQVRFFIDGINHIGRDDNVSSGAIALIAGLKAMSEPQSVRQAIICMAQNDNPWMYGADEVYGTLCDSAIQLYQEGHDEFYQILLDCYLVSAKHALHQKERASLHFFESTGTIKNAVIDICNRSAFPEYLCSMFDQQSNWELLKQAYIDEKLVNHTMFYDIVALFADDNHYTECSELIRRIDGVIMPEREPRVNHTQLREKSLQEYFDALFDRNRAKQLILALIRGSNLSNPTIAELRSANIAFKHDSPILIMKYALQSSFLDSVKAAEVIDWDCWNEFTLMEAERIIAQEKSVKVSSEQEMHLTQLIRSQYSMGCVKLAVNYNRKYPDSIRHLYLTVFRLTVRFDYVPEELDLLRMLELPGFAFMKEDNEEKYKYLERHLSSETILSRIVENMTAHKVHCSVLWDHIEYCTRFHCEDVRECVIDAANDPENDSFVKTAAVKYLYHLFGAQCIRRSILPYADEEMLLTLERSYPDIPNAELRAAMERQFQKTPTMGLMASLLRLGSKMALCEYVRLAEAQNALPEGRDVSHEGPTAAISTLHDPKMLPELEKLLNIALAPDFHDGEFWSLYSSLSKALVECGCGTPEPVFALLERYKEILKGNERGFRFCSYTLDELQRKLCAQQDSPWTLQEVKQLLTSA